MAGPGDESAMIVSGSEFRSAPSTLVVLPRDDPRRGPLLLVPRHRPQPRVAGHPLGVPRSDGPGHDSAAQHRVPHLRLLPLTATQMHADDPRPRRRRSTPSMTALLQGPATVNVEQLRVPLRDGAALAAVLHRPALRRTAAGPAQSRTPYSEPMARTLPSCLALDAGFAVLVQNCPAPAARTASCGRSRTRPTTGWTPSLGGRPALVQRAGLHVRDVLPRHGPARGQRSPPGGAGGDRADGHPRRLPGRAGLPAGRLPARSGARLARAQGGPADRGRRRPRRGRVRAAGCLRRAGPGHAGGLPGAAAVRPAGHHRPAAELAGLAGRGERARLLAGHQLRGAARRHRRPGAARGRLVRPVPPRHARQLRHHHRRGRSRGAGRTSTRSSDRGRTRTPPAVTGEVFYDGGSAR